MKVISPDPAAPKETDPRYDFLDYEKTFLTQLITDPNSLMQRTLNCFALAGVPASALGNHRKIRACEAPSSNAIANTRSVAKLASAVFQPKELFQNPETLNKLLECADTYLDDSFLLSRTEFTQGGLARIPAWDKKHTVTFGWGGAGGQLVRMVPELGLSCAYLTNTLGSRMAVNDPRANALLEATLDAL